MQPTIPVTFKIEAREPQVKGYLEQFSETLPISIIKQKVKIRVENLTQQ